MQQIPDYKNPAATTNDGKNIAKEGEFAPRRIGIMGGTFNPIHNGHLLIAENARKQFELDKVYFIPTGPSPHKNEQIIIPGELRYHMTELAVAGNSGFAVSDIEITSDERSYTYRTLEKLTEMHPKDCYFFIMGGDSLRDFPTWKNPKRICELCQLLAAVRDNLDQERLSDYAEAIRRNFQGTVEFVNTPNFSVSSREIRSRIKSGQSIRYLVPDQVRRYIEEQQLYQE